jgi:hypothetical protein
MVASWTQPLRSETMVYIPQPNTRFHSFCPPTNPYTGNPIGVNLSLKKWCKKYHYSTDQARKLQRLGKIKAFKFRNRILVLDKKPDGEEPD